MKKMKKKRRQQLQQQRLEMHEWGSSMPVRH
jgi:hypothetical protein